jgi:hypothetical protein
LKKPRIQKNNPFRRNHKSKQDITENLFAFNSL